MTNRELVYQAIELFETHIKDNKSIGEIAKEIGFSKYYFCRLFKELTGYTPHVYHQLRKLTEASKLLVSSDKKIIDIALDFGFNSPEVFARAFSKAFKVSPSEARKQGYVSADLIVEPIRKSFINKYDHVLTKEPELVELDEIKLIGIQFYYDLSQKNDLSEPWQILMDNLKLVKHIKTPNKFYQFQYWLEDQSDDCIFFFAAVEVSEIEDVPLAMTSKCIPKQSYFKFIHRGRSNEVGYTYEYIYGSWLPETNYLLNSDFNFELYGSEYLGPYNDESISEIYIPRI